MPQLGRQLRILELDEARGCTSEPVIALIAKDTRLVENVLRYIRPARTGEGGQLSSLSDAIEIVGLHGLKITALSLGVIAHEFKLDCPSFDQNRFKLQSLGCGIAAQSLCRDLRWASPAEAFGAGVLSQIGRLALAHAFPSDYAEVLAQCHGSSAQLETLEEARFGIPYSVISENLLREWGLPQPLCHAIGQLGRFRDPWSVAPLPRLLRIAEIASNVICPVTDGARRDITDLVEIAGRLGEVGERRCLSLTSTLFSELADAISQLGLAQVSLCDVRDRNLERRSQLEAGSRANGASLAQRRADLVKAAYTDGLTGIANRAAFDDRLTQELRRVGRYGMHAVVLLVDVDHMKLINNTVGYLTGDYVLRTVGRTLAELIREVDFCARFGGDEFAILATMSCLDDVAGLAERLCRAIEALPVLGLNRDLNVKVSIGVSWASDVYDMESASEAILRAASDRLFLAKQSGGNQYCIQGRPRPAAPRTKKRQEASADAEQSDQTRETGRAETPPDGRQADHPTPEYAEQY
jgi:diguanylate cyclase (GGDEF)-like protein